MIQIPISLESVCGCVPSTVADNSAILSELVGPAKADAIVKSTGFPFRRVAAPGTTVFDLAVAAARRALDGVDPASLGGIEETLPKEILERYKKLNLAPYKGFVNPVYTAVRDEAGNITDVQIDFTEGYIEQHLRYSRDYSPLPDVN